MWTLTQVKAKVQEKIRAATRQMKITSNDLADVLDANAEFVNERHDSMKTTFDAFTTTWPNRFSSLRVELYVDAVSGLDTNTGLSAGQAVKTFERVAALVTDKFDTVIINLLNDYTFSSSVTLRVPTVYLRTNGKNILFKKRDINIGGTFYGQGSYFLGFYSFDVYINGRGADGTTIGRLETEAHTGMAINSANYFNGQGGIRIGGNIDSWTNGFYGLTLDALTLKAGSNSYLLMGSMAGAAAPYTRHSCLYKIATTETVDSGATLSFGFLGDDTLVRTYTPTSSTDAKVRDDEMVQDSNFIYLKSGGTIKKIAKVAF